MAVSMDDCVWRDKKKTGGQLLFPGWLPLQTTWGGEREQREKNSTEAELLELKISFSSSVTNQEGTRTKQKENLESLEAGTGSTAGTHGGT